MKSKHFVFCVILFSAIYGVGFCEQKTETEYYAVIMEGKKIGHAIGTRTVDGDIVTTTEKMNLTITRAGISLSIGTVETSIETIDGKPRGFQTVENISGMTKQVKGTVNDQGKIDIVTTAAGTEEKKTIDFPSGAVMAEGLRLIQKQNGQLR